MDNYFVSNMIFRMPFSTTFLSLSHYILLFMFSCELRVFALFYLKFKFNIFFSILIYIIMEGAEPGTL